MPQAAIVSFRLGGPDGVSVEAAKWRWALEQLGWTVRGIAGEGPPSAVDVVLPGLAIDAPPDLVPSAPELRDLLDPFDLVIVENLCSLPLNPTALDAVAAAIAGRPAVLRHHDLPWQRPRFASWTRPVPHDPAWAHIVINDLTRQELAERGIVAATIRNAFDVDAPHGDRDATRATLGVANDEVLLVQPTRALPRKNIPAALALAAELGATYWLVGPAEDGYGPELEALVREAERRGTRVIRGDAGTGAATAIRHAYAGSDAISFPSTWEGFGNPTIESAIYRRPLAIGDYPVARELRRYGFTWFPADDGAPLARFLESPSQDLLDHNLDLARRFFSMGALVDRLALLLERTWWKVGL